jgi:hypothetical protein
MNYPEILKNCTPVEKKRIQKLVHDKIISEKHITRIVNDIFPKASREKAVFFVDGKVVPITEKYAIIKLVSIFAALKHVEDRSESILDKALLNKLLVTSPLVGSEAADEIIIHHLLTRLFYTYTAQPFTGLPNSGKITGKNKIINTIIKSYEYNYKADSIADYIKNLVTQSEANSTPPNLYIFKLDSLQGISTSIAHNLDNFLLTQANSSIIILSIIHTNKGSGWKLEYTNAGANLRKELAFALSSPANGFDDLTEAIKEFLNPMSRERLYDLTSKLRSQARVSDRLCYNPDCPTNEKAIGSHLLQENGVIDHIAQQTSGGKKVVELKINNNFQEIKTGHRYGFNLTGTGSASELVFLGFCSFCDDNKFKELEKASCDFNDSHIQLLLSYRAHLNELYKQESNALLHISIRENPEIPQHIKDDVYIPRQVSQATAALNGYKLKLRIEKSLKNPSLEPPFKFLYFTLPEIGVATSAIFASGWKEEVDKNKALSFRPDYRQVDSSTDYLTDDSICFIHLIPNKNQTVFILGFNENTTHINSISVESIKDLNINEKLKLISDILITRVETWFISLSFYKHLQDSNNEERILTAIDYHLPSKMKQEPVDANIFEGLF